MSKFSLEKLLQEALSEVEMQVIADKIRLLMAQYRFPEWVVDSWIDNNKYRAVPLRDGSWLRTVHIDKPNERMDVKMGESILYAGEIHNSHGKVVGGIEVVNILDEDEIDMNIWKDLIKFTREVKRIEREMIMDKNLIRQHIKDMEQKKADGETSLGRLAQDPSNIY